MNAQSVLDVVLIFSILVLSFAMLGMMYRIVVGPTLHDRVLSLDALGVLLMGFIALISMMIHSQYLTVVILLIGILAFIATIGFAKYLEKGLVIENDRDSDD
ncbi:Na(+)/H(+) antiporter subunit F1 [Aliicoccus persicus]|uniref:Multisubunit sodium/proton antiporter, MrpF subunit n=1 Tax=Aliicoccus persicus TaxID=930138 RepID=A0A662Z3E2_9STAP|nr:Na(+)/H(+) antiporter subunit F1 [Aliicoccus persicus]SEW01996.1 multisubunit sodium/proton antiporter, MrpF subunit [Aliicoccus persicus]HJE20359.1 Na(+)/H(+) antiporter subunit F1 [Aliicoccus persicus]